MANSVDSELKGLFESISKSSFNDAARTTVYGDIDYSQLGVTFFGALGLLLVAWILFEHLAKGIGTRTLFRQRLFDPACIEMTKSGSDHRAAPPDILKGNSVLLGAFSIDAQMLPGLMGPGAHLSYRLMRHCTYFASVAMVYSILVLVPVYISQFHQRDRERNAALLNMIAITHISYHNPSHMWVLVMSSFLMCAFWVIVIYSEWEVVKNVRLAWEHDSLSVHSQSHYSLLIERRHDDPPVDLRRQLSHLVGKDQSEVIAVSTIIDTESLERLQQRLWLVSCVPPFCFIGTTKRAIVSSFENQIDLEQSRLRKLAVQSHKRSTTFQDNSLVTDGSDVLQSDLHESGEEAITEGKPRTSLSATAIRTTSSILTKFSCLFKTFRVPTYFVTLRTMSSRTILSHMYRAHSSSSTSGGDSFARITPAPAPSNVIWANVTVERRVIVVRKFLVRVMLLGAGFMFAIPITKIQGYAREYERDESANNSTEFGSAIWRSELFSLYLPAIIQVVLSQTIPRILRFLSLYYERFKTYQDVSRFVLHRTFIFQLLTIYIIVFGDVWVDFTHLKHGPSIFCDSMVIRFRRLGQDIPPVAHYFASTVILSLVTETALEMIMPFKLFTGLLNKYFYGAAKAWEHCGMVQFRHSSSMASYISLLSIMFTFSLISPIVVLFCWCFWTLSYVWNTYAFIYLNNRKYEVGASFAPTIYSGIVTSLVVSQFALFIVVWSSDSSKWTGHISGQVYSFGALMLLLLIFKYIVMRNFTLYASEFTSLSISTDIDRRPESNLIRDQFSESYYLQPDLDIRRSTNLRSIPEVMNRKEETEFLMADSA